MGVAFDAKGFLATAKKSRLSPEEAGVFAQLYSLMCARGGPLPDDLPAQAHALRMKESTLARVVASLLRLGVIFHTGESLSCLLLDQTLDLSKRRSSFGAHGAEKSNKSKAMGSAKPQKQQHNVKFPPQGVAIPNAPVLPEPPDMPALQPVRPWTDEQLFDTWYGYYPRRVGRGQALRAYKAALKKGVNPDTLDAGVRRFARLMRNQEVRYIPHPATWLNGERWLDDPDDTSPPSNGAHNGKGPHDTSRHATGHAALAGAILARIDRARDLDGDGV